MWWTGVLCCRPCKWGFIVTQGYTPSCSFPPLSALCNLILLCTQAPPPRQLTFPLIHSEIPQGVNSYTPVYSHHTASTGLILLIKLPAVNQLTDLGPLSILLFILFIGMLTVVDLCCWECFQIREGRGASCVVSATFRQIQFVCCSSAHQQYLIVCSFSVGSWHAGVAMVWILSTACYSQLTNALAQNLDLKLRSSWTLAHYVIQPAVVCHHSFASTVCRNNCESTASPNKLPLSDQTASSWWVR